MVSITVAGKTIIVSNAAHWRTVREHIDSLYTALAALGGEQQGTATTSKENESRYRKDGSTSDYIIRALQDGPMTAPDILKSIKGMGWHYGGERVNGPYNSVYCEIGRCQERGTIRKAGRMKWEYCGPALTTPTAPAESEQTDEAI